MLKFYLDIISRRQLILPLEANFLEMLQNEECQVPSSNLTQGHQNLVHILPMFYQSNQRRVVSLQCCFAFDFEQGDLVGRKDPVISIN